MAWSAIQSSKCTSLIASLAVAVSVWTVGAYGLLASPERVASDLLVRWAATFPPSAPYELPDVAVVAIDSRSVAGHSAERLASDRYAAAIRRLEAAGVRAIAIDLGDRPMDDTTTGDLAMAWRRLIRGSIPC